MLAQFNPELSLGHAERAQLVQLAALPGYKVLHQIMRAEVDKFVTAWMNVDQANDAAIVAAHRMSKAAAQFYQGVTNRINEEITQYTSTPRIGDVPVDVTEGLIDLGEEELTVFPVPGGEG